MCADCHLTVSDTAMGEGHGQRDHTFAVDLETCSNCHTSESMHDATIVPTAPAAVVAASLGGHPAATEADMSAEAEALPLVPEPISPFGFAVIAALIGMGFGIVAAPWLESWYRRMR